ASHNIEFRVFEPVRPRAFEPSLRDCCKRSRQAAREDPPGSAFSTPAHFGSTRQPHLRVSHIYSPTFARSARKVHIAPPTYSSNRWNILPSQIAYNSTF